MARQTLKRGISNTSKATGRIAPERQNYFQRDLPAPNPPSDISQTADNLLPWQAISQEDFVAMAGPWGPKRLGALEQSVEAQARSFASIPYAAGGDSSSVTGHNPVPDNFEYIWVLIQPVSNSIADPVAGECSLRHAWEQRIPQQGGCWNTPTPAMSGTEDEQPAFEENGGAITNTAVIKQLRPGSIYVNGDGVYQQEWLFKHC